MMLRCALVMMMVGVVIAAPPFTITDETLGTGADMVHLKVITNVATREYVQIVTDVGGRVEALYLRTSSAQGGSLRSILQGHNGDAKAIRANPYWRGCFLAPYANRIANGTYSFDGNTYYMPRNEMPTRNASLHGFLCGRPLTVVSTHIDDHYATLTLAVNFDGNPSIYPGYPFAARVELEYKLTSHGAFNIRASVTNTQSATGLPWSFGWHPYFIVSDVSKAVVTFDTCSKWNHIIMGAGAPRDGDLIPTGRMEPVTGFDGSSPIGGTSDRPTYYDDGFKARNAYSCPTIETKIYDPAAKVTVHLWQDASFRFTQIFTGAKEKWGDSAIAFEPMSGSADTYNNHDGIQVIGAGETWQGQFGVFIR